MNRISAVLHIFQIGVNSLNQNKLGQNAGFLYATDVLGATIGALLTATLLIPLFGITALAVFCAVLNTAVLVLLLIKQ